MTVQFRHSSRNPAAGIGLRQKTASLPAYYTRSFCRSCNGGWMSRLEEHVRPVLEPLMLGHESTLTATEQQTLALWSTKTMLAFQSIEDQQTRFARDEDFRRLYSLMAPLPYGQVWLGANVHGEAGWYRAHSIRLPTSAANAIDGFGAMLSVGFAVLYGVFLFDGASQLRLLGDGAFVLLELGAREDELLWPPPLPLQEVNLTGLPEALMRRSRLVQKTDPLAGETEAS